MITERIQAAARGGADDVRRLAETLIGLDATGTRADGLAALAQLTARPRLLARLDEHLRSVREPPVNGDRMVQIFDHGVRRPVAVALVSLHRDGRRREQAVRAMIAEPHPALVPFLVLRTGDWVREVRDPARRGLAQLLTAAPAEFLPAAAPIARRLSGRIRGAYADAQLSAAVVTAPDDVRRRFTASRSILVRRLAFDADRMQDRLSTADLAAIAIRENDSIIRSRAAGLVARDALWRRDIRTLRHLAGARWADVRALALTGLIRLDRDAEVARLALDDASGLVRSLGRAAARRAGIDAKAHYRAAVAGSPTPGAVAGLSEAGSGRDADLLIPLLEHSGAKLRAAAVRAIVALSAVPVDRVVPLLRDPAAAVVREASLALRPIFRLLPAGLAGELMADARPEVRLAGYRLLGGQDIEIRYAAAQVLAGDDDERLAQRGRADVIALARRA